MHNDGGHYVYIGRCQLEVYFKLFYRKACFSATVSMEIAILIIFPLSRKSHFGLVVYV